MVSVQNLQTEERPNYRDGLAWNVSYSRVGWWAGGSTQDLRSGEKWKRLNWKKLTLCKDKRTMKPSDADAVGRGGLSISLTF